MTLICAFTFYGEAIAKGRPRARAFRVGDQTRAHIYTPDRTKSFESKVKAVAAAAMAFDGSDPTPDAVHVEIGFEKAMPVSWSKKRRLLTRGEPITQAPDLDNQVKAVLDALNGVVFEDDKQVSDLSVSRRWGESDNFRISISLANGPGFLSEAA